MREYDDGREADHDRYGDIGDLADPVPAVSDLSGGEAYTEICKISGYGASVRGIRAVGSLLFKGSQHFHRQPWNTRDDLDLVCHRTPSLEETDASLYRGRYGLLYAARAVCFCMNTEGMVKKTFPGATPGKVFFRYIGFYL